MESPPIDVSRSLYCVQMPFPEELRQWFPDDDHRGRVRALGEEKVNQIIANGQDDVASIPGTLAGHAGLPVVTGNSLNLPYTGCVSYACNQSP